MINTTKFLMEEFGCVAGYTQSDEITLLWAPKESIEDTRTTVPFSGRYQKIASLTAATASSFFNLNNNLESLKCKNKIATFDCRVWSAASESQAVSAFVWRELDARKNSVSQLAQHYFSHKSLDKKSTSAKILMLESIGVHWYDLPNRFKHGTYVLRRTTETKFSTEELSSLPEKHEARRNPELTYKRSVLQIDSSFCGLLSKRLEEERAKILFGDLNW